MKLGWNRRSFLTALGAASSLFTPLGLNANGMFGKKRKPVTALSVDGAPIVPITSGLGSTGDIYAELGVTPLININGTVTVIGGSVMHPEVMELMRRGNEHFVLIDELEIAAGKFIANLCKSPAGYTGLVTAGAAAVWLSRDWPSTTPSVMMTASSAATVVLSAVAITNNHGLIPTVRRARSSAGAAGASYLLSRYWL